MCLHEQTEPNNKKRFSQPKTLCSSFPRLGTQRWDFHKSSESRQGKQERLQELRKTQTPALAPTFSDRGDFKEECPLHYLRATGKRTTEPTASRGDMI